MAGSRIVAWSLALLVLLVAGGLASSASGAVVSAQAASGNPFKGRGMWIWVLSDSNGGNLASIIARAHHYGIGTLYIKSSDGTSMWPQFNPTTVATLKASGLRVCAWQYVYGNSPRVEAQVGADAVSDGANCLVIDAEAQYQGKYYQAQEYITRLRQLIGSGFPVALTGLPYVDYHPSFPYSVFLGPGGAQYNMPQMYWRDIGTTVDEVYAHTYLYNRIYDRPIYPLGQLYNSPPTAQVVRFRQLMPLYGAGGVSWWDWQEAGTRQWQAISESISRLSKVAAVQGEATISRGSAGDLVVWAQEHLRSAGEDVAIDGGFGAQTQTAVESFQLAHGLVEDGVIGTQTWAALLQYAPAPVQWTKSSKVQAVRIGRGRRITAAQVAAADTGAGSSSKTTPQPLSALLPAERDEISGSPGAGRP